jgi:hypothetical protein
MRWRRGHAGSLLGLLCLGVLGGGAAVATGDAVPPGILRPGRARPGSRTAAGF